MSLLNLSESLVYNFGEDVELRVRFQADSRKYGQDLSKDDRYKSSNKVINVPEVYPIVNFKPSYSIR